MAELLLQKSDELVAAKAKLEEAAQRRRQAALASASAGGSATVTSFDRWFSSYGRPTPGYGGSGYASEVKSPTKVYGGAGELKSFKSVAAPMTRGRMLR